MSSRPALLLPLVALAAPGCGISGSGRIVSQDRGFVPFAALDVRGAADVKAVRGKGAIAVTTDDNLLSYVVTRVEGDRLVIDEQGHDGGSVCLHPTHGIVVELSVPEALTDLSVSGSGRFEWLDSAPVATDRLGLHASGSGSIRTPLQATEVDADLSGSGSVLLQGAATRGRFSVSGSGSLAAFGLTLEAAEVSTSGSGSAELTVSGTLAAQVSGSGSVRYRGRPVVSAHVSGSGSVTGVN